MTSVWLLLHARDRGGFTFVVCRCGSQLPVLFLALAPAGKYVWLHVASLISSPQNTIFIYFAQCSTPSTFLFLFWRGATA